MPSTAADIFFLSKFQVIIPEALKLRRPSCMTSERRVNWIFLGLEYNRWIRQSIGDELSLNSINEVVVVTYFSARSYFSLGILLRLCGCVPFVWYASASKLSNVSFAEREKCVQILAVFNKPILNLVSSRNASDTGLVNCVFINAELKGAMKSRFWAQFTSTLYIK